MIVTTFASSRSDIELCQKAGVSEVLLEPKSFSRFGILESSEIQDLAKLASEIKLTPILVFDNLVAERDFLKHISFLQQLDLGLFSAIRVQDIGLANYIRDSYPNIPIQLIVESGNNNSIALGTWCELFGKQLDRLILSIELTEDKIIELGNSLPTKIEILGAGPILMFHSARSLLSDAFNDCKDSKEFVKIVCSSQDSHDRPLTAVENRNGTYLFLNKDYFILDKLDGIRTSATHAVRIDLRDLSSDRHSCEKIDLFAPMVHCPSDSVSEWPRPAGAQFFKTNKTTKQFAKLKSTTLSLKNETCIARVIASERDKFIAYSAIKEASLAGNFRIVLANGKELPARSIDFLNSQKNGTSKCCADEIFFSSWISKVTPGALLFVSQ